MKKILLSFAHPDDESFTCGLTIPKYVKNGWDAVLLCATNGEKGDSGDLQPNNDNELGIIRKSETKQAAKSLGISKVEFLGYKDGKLKDVNSGELENIIYEKMIENIPEIVITYDPGGITNHPDHKKISLSTTYAFQKYARELDEVRGGLAKIKQKEEIKIRHFLSQHRKSMSELEFVTMAKANILPKLYYAVLPETTVNYMIKIGIFPKEQFGVLTKGVPDSKVTTLINGKDSLNSKIESLYKHISQKADVDRYLRLYQSQEITQEYFILRMVGTTEYFMGKYDRIQNKL